MNTIKMIFTRHVASFPSRPSRRTRVVAVAIAGLLSTVVGVTNANALSCARGVYRAGCVSAHGAVGVSRNGVVAVGPYGSVYSYHRSSGCFWRNGQRICM